MADLCKGSRPDDCTAQFASVHIVRVVPASAEVEDSASQGSSWQRRDRVSSRTLHGIHCVGHAERSWPEFAPATRLGDGLNSLTRIQIYPIITLDEGAMGSMMFVAARGEFMTRTGEMVINARSETVATNGLFKFAYRPCQVRPEKALVHDGTNGCCDSRVEKSSASVS